MTDGDESGTAWRRAILAAAAFALDPDGAGIVARAGPGPVLDAWLQQLRAALAPRAPMRRIPAGITDDRLLGDLDIAATLKAGRPVAETGVLAQADGGVLVLAMAERISPGAAARLAAALDTESVTLERDGFALRLSARVGVVALDEGLGEDERPPGALLDRCGPMVGLGAIGRRDIEPLPWSETDFESARALLPRVTASPTATEALVGVAAELGIASLRPPMLALRMARALCALEGRTQVVDRDVSLSAILCLAPRATRLPSAEPDENAEPPPETDSDNDREPRDSNADREADRLEDVVLAASRAAIPAELLARIAAGQALRTRSTGDGKAGAFQASSRRGRPIGARPGTPREGRLSLVSTLRAAAPWQPLRRREASQAGPQRILVRPEGLRIVRYRQRRGATTIFVIDASGSAAFHRLAEVKGAVELLLADCYVRRDSVALVAFRGEGAEIILPPTRSTARAKPSLAGLPGGGGTPLASGIDAGALLADQVRRKGQSAFLVLMTDGRANVGRDGKGGRARAMEDALDAGRRLGAAGIAALAIDTSPPSRRGEASSALSIAEAMGARYVKLPVANAALINEAVRSASGT